MSERYTRRDANTAFVMLCKASGRRMATKYNDVGAWRLDYAGAYGGFVIEEIINDGGGVTHPMGDLRRPAREFVNTCHFARRLLEATR